MAKEMISIAMATYNGEKYLREQLDSILAQTHQNFELIVCDDCSTDSTVQILREYEKNDSRIKVFVNEENLGFKKNFEKAIGLCSGDYIALSDQDDIWLPEHLEKLYSHIGEHMLICANSRLIDKYGNDLHQNMKPTTFFVSENADKQFLQLLHTNFVQGCTALFRSYLVKKAFPIPDEPAYHDYWIALIAALHGTIRYILDVIVLYRQHEGTVTSDNKKSFAKRIRLSFSQDLYAWYEARRKWHCALSRLSLPKENESAFSEAMQYFENFLEQKHKCQSIGYFCKNYKYMYCTTSYKLFLPRLLKNFIFYTEPVHSYISPKNTDNRTSQKILITKVVAAPYDGVFSYLYGILSHIDLSSVQVDLYASVGNIESTFIFQKLMDLGINVFVGTKHAKYRYSRDKKNLSFLMRKTNYSVLYVNTGSPLVTALHIMTGARYGIKKRISHSHNSFNVQREKSSILKKLLLPVVRKAICMTATDFLACSEVAGQWLFGKKTMKKKGVVVKNGINVDVYQFDLHARNILRRNLNIADFDCVLGLSAYFIPQKNHAFLINVFAEFLKINPDAKLLLLGDGTEKEKIVVLAKKLGVYEKTYFMGSVSNANEYYSAMDVFVMPSVHEGLPFVGVEAQSACLPCLFSDAITQELNITGYAHFFSLDEPAEQWAKTALQLAENSSVERRSANIIQTQKEIMAHGYDLQESAATITSLLNLNGGYGV